jgi:putative ABC transport system permease protein
MNPFRNAGRKLRAFLQQPRLKQEIDEELQFHIEQRTAENTAAGMPPEEAAREARRRFGNFQNSREECRRLVSANFGESVLQDIRFGLRSLSKNPGFTAVSITTLALGVGATTAIYSVVNAVILNPVSGPDPERVVQIAERNYTQGLFKDQNNQLDLYGVCPEVLEALLPHTSLFANFAWCDTIWLSRKTEDFTETILCDTVPSTFFGLWNVPPLLGRTFAPDEAVPLNDSKMPVRDSVLVLSYTMWRSHFAGDRNIIGRMIEMSGRNFTVIGVMPEWFAPEGSYSICWLPAEPWHIPANQVGLPNTRVRARLTPGTSLAQAQAMLDTVAAQLQAAHTDDFIGKEWKRRPHGLGITVRPLQAQFQGSYGSEDLRRTLFGLLGAICFVLLIVCANIANLTLARTERRQQELAIRSSIGAGRWRLMRQLLTESILLACAGGLAGIAVSVLGMKVLLSVVPGSMPRLRPVELDIHALVYTLLISIATGILFGLMPAWRAGRAELSDALKQAGTGATVGVRHSRYRGTLVVAETALAVVLLAGAGLMIKSVVRLLHVNPGFDPENLVCVSLQLPWQKYSDFTASADAGRASQLRKLLFGQLQERIQAVPGVVAVGIGKHSGWPEKVMVEGSSQQIEVVREGCGVGPGDLFRAMRAPLLAGRLLEDRDRGVAAGTAVINETMARTLWPGVNPLGKKFEGLDKPGGGGTERYEVIGIVGNLRDSSYTEQIRPAFYRPCDELDLMGRPTFLVIRTKADPRLLIPAIRKELKVAEPDMNTPEFTIEEQQLYDSTQAQRTYMEYLVVFAGVGVLLCAIGIYGVLAYSVARRAREIGIRIAIGAQREDVLRLVIGEGLRLVLAGLAAGLVAAFWLTKFLRSQLFEVTPTDPWVMASVVALLLGVALLACYFPGRRAAKVDPMSALRYE